MVSGRIFATISQLHEPFSTIFPLLVTYRLICLTVNYSVPYTHTNELIFSSIAPNTPQLMQNLLGTTVLSGHLDPSVFHQQRAPLCWEDALWLLCFAKRLVDTKTNRRADGTFPLTELTISCVLHIKHLIDPHDQSVNHFVLCVCCLISSFCCNLISWMKLISSCRVCVCVRLWCEAVGQIRPLYVTGEAANKKQCKQM